MKIYVLIWLSLLLMYETTAQGQNVTWNENIACIMYTRCTSCHHEGGIAPFSLMTYEDAVATAFGVLQSVNNGSMPPWPPDPNYRSFAHERVLSQEEIDAINEWVNNGTPLGFGVPPMPPVYDNPEAITSPDLVLSMPTYTVSSVGNDVYRCFVIPSGLLQDRYINEIEVVPGNREVVHHVLLYQDVSITPALLDAADPGPGYTSFGGTGSNSSVLIGAWVPGQGKKSYPGSMGVRIPVGANIVIQVHYPPTANGQQDQTKVNLKFTTGPAREVSIATPLNHSTLNEGPLIIPANTVRTFTSNYLLPPVNITALDVAPHMHLIGKSIKAWAVTPFGVTIPLIDIPEWDFHWQGMYDFRQPIRIPAGSLLYGTATYDNTSANPNNPNNPPQMVTVGEATDDEMMLIYFSFTVHFPGDENIVIDTSTTIQTHNSCDFRAVALSGTAELNYLDINPNPTGGFLNLGLPDDFRGKVIVSDSMGRLVLSEQISGRNLDLGNLSDGLYLLTLEAEGGSSTRKIIIRH
jgi:hypothetical protein